MKLRLNAGFFFFYQLTIDTPIEYRHSCFSTFPVPKHEGNRLTLYLQMQWKPKCLLQITALCNKRQTL